MATQRERKSCANIWYQSRFHLGCRLLPEAYRRWRRSPAAARWSSGPCVGPWRWAALWLSWRVADAAGGDVVGASTAEAAEALRGGAAAQHGMAAWRPRRCMAIRRGGEPGAAGACYGCALDASGALEPRAWTASRRWTWLRRSRTCAAGARAGSAATWGVRAKGTAVAETRRSRGTSVMAQRSRQLGATTVEGVWYGDAAWRPMGLRAAAAEENLWRVSPKMKKGVPRVNEEPVSCTSGWGYSHGLGG
ncbi:hypothetical protein VPH35_128630 [Triticum aestivum]